MIDINQVVFHSCHTKDIRQFKSELGEEIFIEPVCMMERPVPSPIITSSLPL